MNLSLIRRRSQIEAGLKAKCVLYAIMDVRDYRYFWDRSGHRLELARQTRLCDIIVMEARPDPLEQEIEAKRVVVAGLERQLEREKLELSALERAASLRPRMMNGSAEMAGQGSVVVDAKVRSPGGRMPGSLSHQWRKILSTIVAQDNLFMSPMAVCLLAKSLGITVGPKTAAVRLKRYNEMGFTERRGETYRVTQTAIERFGFYSLPRNVPDNSGPSPRAAGDGPD